MFDSCCTMDTPNHRSGLLIGAEALHERTGYFTLGVPKRREYWGDREDTDHFVTLAAPKGGGSMSYG